MPTLQVAGQVVSFLTAHLGYPIPSPALLEKVGNRFRREVHRFAVEHQIPILQLKKPDRTRWDDRKLDHVRPYLDRAEAAGRHGVVALASTSCRRWVGASPDCPDRRTASSIRSVRGSTSVRSEDGKDAGG